MSVKPPSQVPAPPEGNKNWGPLINITDGWIEALDVTVMVLRVVTRLKLTKSKLWWDDYFILAALVATLWQLAGNGIEYVTFISRPSWGRTIPISTTSVLTTRQEFTTDSADPSITLRIMNSNGSWPTLTANGYRPSLPLQAAIIFLLGSGIILIILWTIQCHPIETAWDLKVPGMCFPKSGLIGIIMAQAIISIVSDFGLSLYPILILKNLQLTRRNKIGLCILMGLGCITGACAIVRTVMYHQWIPDDVTYGGIENWFWRTFEVNLGMVCVCIPTLVPGWKWLRRRLRQRAQRHLPDNVAPNGPSPAADRKEVEEIRHPEPSARKDASRTERALMGRFAADLESQTPTHRVEVDDAPDLPHGQQRVAMVLGEDDIRDTMKKSRQDDSDSSWFSDKRASTPTDGDRDPSPASGTSKSTARSDAPLVRNASDPEKALDVDVQPSFRENRNLWRRMLRRINESSPGNWLTSTANVDSKVSRPAND
ncbi:MAG: hypothetical protein Q9162_001450 [Coniocarpon cinnabarinum]